MHDLREMVAVAERCRVLNGVRICKGYEREGPGGEVRHLIRAVLTIQIATSGDRGNRNMGMSSIQGNGSVILLIGDCK